MAGIELTPELKQQEEDLQNGIQPTLREREEAKVLKTKISLIEEDDYTPPSAWGEGFNAGADAINVIGRPPKMRNLEKKTNRQIREQELLSLTRKFKPHVTKAIQAAVKIIDNPDAADSNKLKASALLVQTYRQLLLDTFDHRYDSDEGTEVQDDNSPMFSLKIVGDDNSEG